MWRAEKGASMRHLADRLAKAERAVASNDVGSRLDKLARRADSVRREDCARTRQDAKGGLATESSEAYASPGSKGAQDNRNRTGVLEPRELSHLLDALGFRADSVGVRDALRKYDANYDGRIDIGEFHDIFRAVMRAEPIREDVCDVFAQYDRNRNGYLEVRELRNALAALGFEADRAAGTTTGSILRHFDADANGRLDLYEFNELVWELQRAVDRAARPTHYRGINPGGARADSPARSPGYYEWRY